MRIISILLFSAFLSIAVYALLLAARYSRAGDKWSAGDYMLASMVMFSMAAAVGIMLVV